MARERTDRAGAAALSPALLRGVRGWLAGLGLLHRASHRARARWVVSLLELRPGDDVLQIGCGPGYALGLIAQATRGRVVGMDPSPLLIRMADRRLRRREWGGRTTLICADLEDLPRFDVAFEKVLAVDAWRPPAEPMRVLGILQERLAPGGRLAIAMRPQERRQDAAATAQSRAAEIAGSLRDSGFQRIETHFHGGAGRSLCVCVTAHRSGPGA